MIRRMKLPIWMALAALAACGGGGGGVQLPEGAVVGDGDFTTYPTRHNGYNRVTKTNLGTDVAADRETLRLIDTGASPAGYRNLIDIADSVYEGKMTIEVIGEVETASGYKAKRVLRLTTDQAPFENVKDGKLVTSTGKYHFRGESYAWVTIDGGPVLSSHHAEGIRDMSIDFDSGTADIHLETKIDATSEIEIVIKEKGLPFNIVTGAYGGAITINVRNPLASDEYFEVLSDLRGNIGGSPTYEGSVHGMSTSGAFSGTSAATADAPAVTVDGVFFGVHEHAL